MRKIILIIVIFLLFIGSSSCSVWRELGETPDEFELKEFESSENFNIDKQIFENQNPELLSNMSKRMDMSATIDFFLDETPDRTPSKPIPEENPILLQSFMASTGSIKFVWLGHSSIMINIQNHILLFDPVFSKAASPIKSFVKRFQPPVINLEELPEIEWVIISHDHYDHLDMETVEFFKDKRTRFAVPIGVGSHLRYWGIPEERIVEMDWWQVIEVDGLTIHCTPAQHFSGRTGQDLKTLWASWSVKSADLQIFFSGDSGYNKHYEQIGKRLGPFKFAFIDSGQYNFKWREVHNTPEEAVKAAKDLRSEYLIPIHWGMFELALHPWYEPAVRSYSFSELQGVNLITPKIGQLVEMNKIESSEQWWKNLMP
jgi:L-ascorbate metabolism protein UlaG (beta-lactamase superfamily)